MTEDDWNDWNEYDDWVSGVIRLSERTRLTGMTVVARMTRVNSITGMTRTIGMTWTTAHFYLNIIKYTFKKQHIGSKLGFFKGRRHYFLLPFCSIGIRAQLHKCRVLFSV